LQVVDGELSGGASVNDDAMVSAGYCAEVTSDQKLMAPGQVFSAKCVHFGLDSGTFSYSLPRHPHVERRILFSDPLDRVLIGTFRPTSRPNNVFRQSSTTSVVSGAAHYEAQQNAPGQDNIQPGSLSLGQFGPNAANHSTHCLTTRKNHSKGMSRQLPH